MWKIQDSKHQIKKLKVNILHIFFLILQGLQRYVQWILNNLTLRNRYISFKKLLDLKVDEPGNLEIFADLLFNNAVIDPTYANTYTQLCEQFIWKVIYLLSNIKLYTCHFTILSLFI